MYMKNWLETLDMFSKDFGMGILDSAGTVSHEDAMDKAHREYDIYKAQQNDELTEVEKAYLETLKQMQKKLKSNESGGATK